MITPLAPLTLRREIIIPLALDSVATAPALLPLRVVRGEAETLHYTLSVVLDPGDTLLRQPNVLSIDGRGLRRGRSSEGPASPASVIAT